MAEGDIRVRSVGGRGGGSVKEDSRTESFCDVVSDIGGGEEQRGRSRPSRSLSTRPKGKRISFTIIRRSIKGSLRMLKEVLLEELLSELEVTRLSEIDDLLLFILISKKSRISLGYWWLHFNNRF